MAAGQRPSDVACCGGEPTKEETCPPVQWLCQCLGVCHGAATIPPRAPKGVRQPARIRGEWGGAALAPHRARVQQERFHYNTAYDTGNSTRYRVPPRSRGPACPGTRASAAAAPGRRLPDWTRASALTRPCLPRLFSLHPPPPPLPAVRTNRIMLHARIIVSMGGPGAYLFLPYSRPYLSSMPMH